MRSTVSLPEDYLEIGSMDLQKDTKTAVLINVMAIVMCVALLIMFFVMRPLDPMKGIEIDIIESLLTIVLLFVYMVLHEMTHGIVMKRMDATHVRYGFTGLYAYAGSEEDYFTAKSYVTIALAPLVIWTVIFVILMILFIDNLYWMLAFLFTCHFSGCAGDMYVAYKVLEYPRDVLIRDTGVDVKIYGKNNEK